MWMLGRLCSVSDFHYTDELVSLCCDIAETVPDRYKNVIHKKGVETLRGWLNREVHPDKVSVVRSEVYQAALEDMGDICEIYTPPNAAALLALANSMQVVVGVSSLLPAYCNSIVVYTCESREGKRVVTLLKQ